MQSRLKTQVATFGAGCFWGVQDALGSLEGVTSTVVGFMGGTMENPSYEDVCTDKTGHAEVVQVTYDPDKISYEKLLEVFWSIHDPTTLDRQGLDLGTQYRSIIFYHTREQEKLAKESKASLESSKRFRAGIVTEIKPASSFFRAEEYHQDYYKKHGIKHGAKIC